MADNVDISPGSGASIATDDVDGVHYQRVKLDAGEDGVSTPVSSAAPLPVSLVESGGGYALTGGPYNVGSNSTLRAYDNASNEPHGQTEVACRWMRIQSVKANAKLLYVGSNKTTLAWELQPGEWVEIPCREVHEIWVKAETNQTVAYRWMAGVDLLDGGL
jgi:hypothetical protein